MKGNIIGYGIAAVAGLIVGYMVFTPPIVGTAVPKPNVTQTYDNRRTEYAGQWAPGAMVAEDLYGRLELHKMTDLTPGAYAKNYASTSGSPTSLIFID